MNKSKITVDVILIPVLWVLIPILMFVYVLFNGYPNDTVSIAVGLTCGVLAIGVIAKNWRGK